MTSSETLPLNMSAQEEQTKNPFKLTKLPFLPLKLAFDFLDIDERINLSLTSNKMENCVRISKPMNVQFRFSVMDEDSMIQVEKDKENFANVHCGERKEYSNIKNIKVGELAKWYPNLKEMSMMTRMKAVFDRVKPIFRSENPLIVEVLPNKMEEVRVQDIFEIDIFKSCGKFLIRDATLENDYIKYIMDTLTDCGDFQIRNCVISPDFRHEKALSYKNVFYSDSRWVTIDDMLALRNLTSVTLENHNFVYEDLNRLLKFWYHSKEDMFLELHLEMAVKNTDALYNGIKRFKLIDHEPLLSYICCDTDDDIKTKPILYSYYKNGKLILKTHPYEECRYENIRSYDWICLTLSVAFHPYRVMQDLDKNREYLARHPNGRHSERYREEIPELEEELATYQKYDYFEIIG